MSVCVKMTKRFTATFKDVTIPESSDNVKFAFETSVPSFEYLRNTDIIRYLHFQNCIITKIPEYLIKKMGHLQKIEVVDSIIGGLDLRNLMELKKIESISLKNTTVEELSGTIFENFKNLTFKFVRETDSNEVSIVVEGGGNLPDLKQPEPKAEAPLSLNVINLSRQKTVETPKKEIDWANFKPKFALSTSPVTPFLFGKPDSIKPKFNFGSAGAALENVQSQTSRMIFSASSSYTPPISTVKQTDVTVAESDQSTPKVPSEFESRTIFKDRYVKLSTMNANLSKDLDILRHQLMKLELENRKLTNNGILGDLQRIFHDEIFKDFTISVNNEKSYKIHKVLFAARSSIFADMIRNNPDAENLDLQDIPLPIFDILLDFIYNDTPLKDDERLIEIFAAAGKLNIIELKNMSASKLLNRIDDKNSYKILELSNKYGNEELRVKAFVEIKKILSEYNLPDEFSKNPEKIKKLLDMKRKMDEEYERMRKEILEFQVFDDEKEEDIVGVSEVHSDGSEFFIAEN